MPQEKKKIAILGGGAAALSAAFGLTEKPNWQEEYEITVYQLGWRLGGKGASGRNRAVYDRIEEHGLHVWGGFYENAFRIMRACYEEMHRDPKAPLATLEDAFKPQHVVTWMENVGKKKVPWNVQFPPNDSKPGDGKTLTVWEYLCMGLDWAIEVFEGFPPPRAASPATAAAPAPPAAGAPAQTHPTSPWHVPDWLRAAVEGAETHLESLGLRLHRKLGESEKRAERAGAALHEHTHAGWLYAAANLARSCAGHPSSHPAGHHEGIVWLLEKFSGWLSSRVEHDLESNDRLRRQWILLDFCFAVINGSLRDGVLLHGFDSIDDQEWSEWLHKHGATRFTLESAMVRGVYDFIFAYRDGDPAKPSVAAGTSTRAMMRLALAYKGAVFYKMQAGMGDTVFTPLYQVLQQRGVRFEFFRRVKSLSVAPDGKSIARVALGRQVTLKSGAYDPLFDAGGLPCWPSEPLYDQIVEGEALRSEGIDLESSWTAWQDVGEDVLEAGRDFDQVVLGISLGALPGICSDLIAQNARWRKMVQGVQTVRTQAVQLWLQPDLDGLGWKFSTILTAYAHPIETWADMTQVLPREGWPAQDGPRNIAYFCGPLQEDGPEPPYRDHAFPAKEKQRVHDLTLAWFQANTRSLWPEAADPGSNGLDWKLLVDLGGGKGKNRFDAQYWRANINPSDRYVLSVPGSTALRLPSHDPDYANLYLAGDWVRNGLNFGCIESAVMGGLQASRALCGYPREIPGEKLG